MSLSVITTPKINLTDNLNVPAISSQLIIQLISLHEVIPFQVIHDRWT